MAEGTYAAARVASALYRAVIAAECMYAEASGIAQQTARSTERRDILDERVGYNP